MRVLFVHRAFPAQFGRLALELTRRYGWECRFLVEHASRCPTPSPEMLRALPLHFLRPPEGADASAPWPRRYGESLAWGERLARAARELPGPPPDLVVGHGGLLPTLFLRDVFPCPLVEFCEYYFAPRRRDLTYRVDLPSVEPAAFFPRCVNATTLVNLLACDAAFTPTESQRRSFPRRYWDRIAVHPDGVDTELYRPRPVPRVVAGRALPPATRVVTFAARGLESMRGFDLFLRVAAEVTRRRPDVLFLIAGGDDIYYGWDQFFTGGVSFREMALAGSGVDRSRLVFLGQVEPERLAEVFCLSDLHLYLSVPFVPSWSLLNAMSCGCVVLAGDDEATREFIEPDRTGLLGPLFDAGRLAETALRVLDDPPSFRPLGEAARSAIVARHHFDVVVPRLADFLTGVARAHPEG